jgi:hypothetical protein
MPHGRGSAAIADLPFIPLNVTTTLDLAAIGSGSGISVRLNLLQRAVSGSRFPSCSRIYKGLFNCYLRRIQKRLATY